MIIQSRRPAHGRQNNAVLVFSLALLAVFFVFPAMALAADDDDEGESVDPPDAAEQPGTDIVMPETKEEHFLGDYGRWIEHAQNTLLEMDMWGSSTTVPEGFAVALVGWGTMRAYKRFDNHRKLIDIVPILKIDDPFHVKDEDYFFQFDFGIRGKGGGYMAAITYGITDRLMAGVSTNWLELHVRLDAKFTPGSSERLGVATREEFFTMLNLLGRPTPKMRYDSKPVKWGDTTAFLTWNYFRNTWYSGGLTGSLILPTAQVADPNENMTFGLGPDLDAGNASWGLALNKVFDFRPPKPANIVTFTIGAEGAYYFQAKRKSPQFLKPDQDAWDYLQAQGLDLDFFPDLSDLDDYYYYTPPPWVAVSGGIGISLLSVTYRHGWGFEGEYESNSPGFKKMIDEIGLVGTGDDGKLIFAAGLPLTPLYLPALAQVRFEYVTDGRNHLVFRDQYQAGIGFFIPINPPARYRLPK